MLSLPMKSKRFSCILITFLVVSSTFLAPQLAWSGADEAEKLLQGLVIETKRPPSAEQGKALFVDKHGRDWSCASCHGAPPVSMGKHMTTNKAIDPLAPRINPERFSNSSKTEKWFRRNCKDVLGRECTLAEKADVLAYLLSLKGEK